MIYTITLNPSVDYFLEVDDSISEKEVNRANKDMFVAAGKGINISKLLNNLKIESHAIVPVGDFSGDFITSQLDKCEYINVHKIAVDGISRINLKIKLNGRDVAINGLGPVASSDTKAAVVEALAGVSEDDYVLISGSMMRGLSFDLLKAISDLVHERNAKLVVDMDMLSVEELGLLKPDFIKPNLEELFAITKCDNIDEAIQVLNSKNIDNILLSKGEDGFTYYEDDKQWDVTVSPVDAINNVGCGDALLAGFVASKVLGNDTKEALKFAGACASARACTLDELSLDTIFKYAEGIKVRFVLDIDNN